MRLAYQLLLNP